MEVKICRVTEVYN